MVKCWACLAPPRTSIPGLEVTDWKNSKEPKLNGQPLVLETGERTRSLAIAPDGQSFLMGTDWYLRTFRRDGSERWSVPAPGVAWAVNLTGDGRLAGAAYGDGTIRWYRAMTARSSSPSSPTLTANAGYCGLPVATTMPRLTVKT